MMPGDQLTLAGYEFQFQGIRTIKKPNYQGDEGIINIGINGEIIDILHPQKRRYNAQQAQIMTEADIDNGLFRDLYVALGEPLAEGAWAVRVLQTLCTLDMVGRIIDGAGSCLKRCNKRYRFRVKAGHVAIR